MRQLRATVTAGSRYGSSSNVRMTFCPRRRLLMKTAMSNPITISKSTAKSVNLTVFQTAWRK